MKLSFMLTAIGVTAVAAGEVSVTVNNGDPVCYEKIDATDKDDIVEWYKYNPADYSAHSGMEDDNAEYIGIAAVETNEGTSVVVIYDTPGQGGNAADGQVDTITKCITPGCNAAAADFLAVSDDPSPSDSYSTDGGRLLITHKWNECCTDGFATKALRENDEVCIWFILEGRDGVENGIRFYEGEDGDDATDITPGNFESKKKTKVCIKNGCGPIIPDCDGPCTPFIDGQPGSDGLICQHNNHNGAWYPGKAGDYSCRVPPTNYPLPCYAGMTLCKAVPPPHPTCQKPCHYLSTYDGPTVCQHNNDFTCSEPKDNDEDYPHCVAGMSICTPQ